MRLSHVRLALPSWLRLPRRTARLRLTALCGGLFLFSGVRCSPATYVLFERATEYRTPHLPKVPRTVAIQRLQLSPKGPKRGPQRSCPQGCHGSARVGTGSAELAGAKPSSVRDQGRVGLHSCQNQLTQDSAPAGTRAASAGTGQQQLVQARTSGGTRRSRRKPHSARLTRTSFWSTRESLWPSLPSSPFLPAGSSPGGCCDPSGRSRAPPGRISSTSLHERLALDGPEDEFKELGDTLDDLFGRLDAAFEAQRHFVANASHELRTPLTRERTLVQVALGDPSTPEVWRSTAEELLACNREQETLIEALLTLASGEGGLDHREPVDLSVIAQTVLHDRRGNGPLGLTIDAAIETAPVDGDPRLVESLVANLVDNAIRHNVESGRVQISVGRKDGEAVITVTNTGPSIEPADIQRLFQPFQRLDPRRSHRRDGHGLGLSIVSAIATAHRASVDAIPEAEGGLSISVSFPAPDDPPGPPSGSGGLISYHCPAEMSAATSS